MHKIIIPSSKTTKDDLVEYCNKTFGVRYKKLSNKKRKVMWKVTVEGVNRTRSAIIKYCFIVNVREPEWASMMTLRWL